MTNIHTTRHFIAVVEENNDAQEGSKAYSKGLSEGNALAHPINLLWNSYSNIEYEDVCRGIFKLTCIIQWTTHHDKCYVPQYIQWDYTLVHIDCLRLSFNIRNITLILEK